VYYRPTLIYILFQNSSCTNPVKMSKTWEVFKASLVDSVQPGQFLGIYATYAIVSNIVVVQIISNACLLYNCLTTVVNKLWCEAQQTPPPAATYRMILTC